MERIIKLFGNTNSEFEVTYEEDSDRLIITRRAIGAYGQIEEYVVSFSKEQCINLYGCLFELKQFGLLEE